MALYKSFSSYSDTGFVRPKDGASPPSCWFETDFQGPGIFRFEFTRSHPYRPLRHRLTKYVIGTDGITPYFCTLGPGRPLAFEQETSLEMAVAGATGISQGAAHTIGSLLLKEVGGFDLTMLKKLRFRRTRVLDQTLCTVISGLHPRGGRYTAWLGSEDLLLRKLIRHSRGAEEVRLNIRVNDHIPTQRFAIPNSEA